MASTTWFVLLRSDSKSSENGILRFFSCVASRCEPSVCARMHALKSPNLIQLITGSFGVVDRGLISVVPKVTSSYKTITS